MAKRNPACWLSLLLLTGACTVGPTYQRPVAPIPPTFTPVTDSKAQSLDLARWWGQFNDPLLTGLIEKALASNTDIEAARARIDQAGAALGLAHAALLPSGALSADYARSRQSVAAAPGAFLQGIPGGFPRDQNDFQLGASASWEIDLFGGNRRGTQAARADLGAAVAVENATRVAVAGSLGDVYIQLRRVQAQRDLVERSLVMQRREVALDRLQEQRGVLASADLARAEAALSAAETRAPALDAAGAALANAIDVLLGEAIGTNRSALAAPSPVPTASESPAVGTPEDLLRRRPDVIAAEAKLIAANARIGQAIGEYYPKLSLGGLLGVDSLTSGDLLTPRGFQARGTAGLRWRLFDFQRIDAEIKLARGTYRERLADYRAAVLKASQDVEDAVAQSNATAATLQLRDSALAAQRHVSEATAVAFKQGAVSEIDRIGADQGTLAARLETVDASAEQGRAVVRLFRALGGGWPLREGR
jgi:NodT family efflux transporter outer membrane factor (OMF) lipoprotein